MRRSNDVSHIEQNVYKSLWLGSLGWFRTPSVTAWVDHNLIVAQRNAIPETPATPPVVPAVPAVSGGAGGTVANVPVTTAATAPATTAAPAPAVVWRTMARLKEQLLPLQGITEEHLDALSKALESHVTEAIYMTSSPVFAAGVEAARNASLAAYRARATDLSLATGIELHAVVAATSGPGFVTEVDAVKVPRDPAGHVWSIPLLQTIYNTWHPAPLAQGAAEEIGVFQERQRQQAAAASGIERSVKEYAEGLLLEHQALAAIKNQKYEKFEKLMYFCRWTHLFIGGAALGMFAYFAGVQAAQALAVAAITVVPAVLISLGLNKLMLHRQYGFNTATMPAPSYSLGAIVGFGSMLAVMATTHFVPVPLFQLLASVIGGIVAGFVSALGNIVVRHRAIAIDNAMNQVGAIYADWDKRDAIILAVGAVGGAAIGLTAWYAAPIVTTTVLELVHWNISNVALPINPLSVANYFVAASIALIAGSVLGAIAAEIDNLAQKAANAMTATTTTTTTTTTITTNPGYQRV